jgi:multidrug efflux pump subunit AcrA (membrane-fusion protein)
MQKTTILLTTSCLVAMFGCAKKEEAEAEAPAPVQVTAVTQDTIRRIVSGDGMLFPRDQASVMPKIASPVQKFYVNRGDHVKQGQLLAVLENRDLTAQAAEGKGAMDQAESNLRTTSGASVPEAVVKAQTDVDADRQAMDAAKKVLDSREQLFKEGALARRQVDEALVSYTQAKSQFGAAQEHLRVLESVAKGEQIKTASAQVESARAHHQSLEAQLSYARILSPIDGVIADRPLYAGEMASPGTPLLTVMDISRIVARVSVPQSQAGTVRVGHPATITQVDSGQEVPGKVIVVSPATDPASTTVQVWVEAENPGERFKPGASVHAAIITEMFKAATVVPVSAILPGEEKGTAVLTIGADSTAHKKQVELGVREGDKVQILSGVKPGEEVVVAGGLGVDDKAKVKVIDTTVQEEDEDETPAPDNAKKDEAKPKAK